MAGSWLPGCGGRATEVTQVIPRIHITGASGCGASTLGKALAARLGVAWRDTDDYFWQATDPPYRTQWPMPERLDRLAAALDDRAGWVLSGSLDNWGDGLIPRIGVELFLRVPASVRMERLRVREQARFGKALEPGGAMHAEHRAFMDWTAGYETGGMEMRSLVRQMAWLAALPCPVLRLDGTRPTGLLVEAVCAFQAGDG